MVDLQTWDKARMVSSIALIEGNSISDYYDITVTSRVVTDVNTPYEAGHSINQYNSHVIEKPPEYTFTIAIAAISDEAELLRDVQSSGIYFRMRLKDSNADKGNVEYKLCSEYFNYCKLTRKRGEITVGEVPMLVFEGIALEYSYDYWKENSDGSFTETILTDNGTASGSRYWFGHGEPIPSAVKLFDNWSA